MKRRECKLGTPSTDLLVCFPSRAHLALMPKPICSPSRPPEPIKHRIHRRKKSISGGCVASGHGHGHGQGQASPLMWSKSKQMGSDISEPTSPKVTCAGQIKVRPRARPGNWQSVMEEIEKLHSERKQKRPSWVEAIGIKKDAVHFLSCLRNIKFDFRCFGAFPTSHITSDDEDDEEDEEQEEEVSRTVFSKWFMVLQENQENDKFITTTATTTTTNITSRDGKENNYKPDDDDDDDDKVSAPPSNALLLMRCRSAPTKRWIEENKVEEEMKEKDILLEEELEMKKKKNMVVMRYYEDDDFYKISSDIAKETWVFGGIKDQLSRSRSWKR